MCFSSSETSLYKTETIKTEHILLCSLELPYAHPIMLQILIENNAHEPEYFPNLQNDFLIAQPRSGSSQR